MTSFYGDNCVAAIDAEWQEWGHWSQCTASCGQGSKVRARACSEPAFGGNEQCPGNYTEAENCETSKCPGSSHRCSLGSATRDRKSASSATTKKQIAPTSLEEENIFRHHCYPLSRKEFSVATMNIVFYLSALSSNKQILPGETLSTNAATASGICQ